MKADVIEAWAWAKLALGVVMFEGTLFAVQGPMQREAELARGAMLAGALIGAAVGGLGHTDRTNVKDFLDEKLGPDDSAVAILIKEADWQAVEDATKQYGGEELAVELTPHAE